MDGGTKRLLTPEQIRARLADRNLKKVADASGINYFTLFRLANGYVETPTPRIIEAVSEYLTRDDGRA